MSALLAGAPARRLRLEHVDLGLHVGDSPERRGEHVVVTTQHLIDLGKTFALEREVFERLPAVGFPASFSGDPTGDARFFWQRESSLPRL